MKILTPLLFCFFAINTQAQVDDLDFFDKGKNLVGISLRGGFGSEGSGAGSVNFRYGRFTADKINLGLDIGYTRLDIWGNAIEFGPFARYYFVKKNFSPILEANYAYGKVTVQQAGALGTGDWHKLGGDLGLTYSGGGMGDFGVELMMEYFQVFSSSRTSFGDITFIGRLLYYF